MSIYRILESLGPNSLNAKLRRLEMEHLSIEVVAVTSHESAICAVIRIKSYDPAAPLSFEDLIDELNGDPDEDQEDQEDPNA